MLFIILGGWGNNFGGGAGYGGGAGGLYPWMNQAEITSGGFRDQMMNNNITSIRDGINNLSTQLCNCCSDMQMATMNQTFGLQNAINQGFNSTQAQLAQCCCDNRLATADLKYTIATEECATRNAAAMNTRDIVESGNRNSQAILDKLCQLELDGLKQDNANLRTQLNMANLAASQTAQTAELRQSGATQLNQLVSELRSCPIPSQPVYGSQPIFTCPNNNCGCGCGNNF